MSKPRPETPSRAARTSFRSQLLQSATWLGWEMPSPAADPQPQKTASTAPQQVGVTPPLGLPAGSEPA